MITDKAKLVKIVKNIMILAFSFAIIFTIFGYNTTDWNGISEEEDKTLYQKIFNRLYLSMVSISTIGFGDISPKTKILRLLMMIYIILIVLLNTSTLAHLIIEV
uniref:Potassium channel domain-containing protein n=1 Tax=viral metagenome TaxID=1070528 RepID=A0A6C0L422_9ZZZZ|tara:strand:+ start:2450 stop:2761 length:312 start_codon:yes stop_codon:yes gene_type:complete